MRIFKNRGDIYFSKTNKEKSNEQKILLFALVFIVIFTIFFVTFTCIKNDFSAKKFFAPENLSTTSINVAEDEIIDMPEVSGKNNFATFVYKNNTLLFVNLTQVDMESKAYKTTTLKPNTEIDGVAISKTFKQGGPANAKNALSNLFGVEIDYYISMDNATYANFFDDMGDINYAIPNEIRYKNNDSNIGYNIKMKAGEQKINGAHFIEMIRYYLEVENSTVEANELFLASLSQHNNSENLSKSERLFRDFVTQAETNITIRDFNGASDELYVLCNDQSSMHVYSAEAKYDGNKIEKNSLKKVKGYFVK